MFHPRGALLLFAAWTAIAVCPRAARAQPVNDHLKCYKVKDSLSLAAVADLNGPQYGLEPNCKISRPLLFCVPVTKTVKSAFDTSTHPPTPITPLPVSGPDPGDRICYRISCPPGPAISQLVTDQFGTRGVTGVGKPPHFQAFMLCTPAVKGGLPTTTTTTTSSTTTSTIAGCSPGGGACAGPCPNPSDVCFLTAAGCTCGCGVNSVGVCGGTCPNPNDVCTQPLGVVCGCYAHCGAPQFPACNGNCPVGTTCTPDPTVPTCFCQ
jgi:hypothetical protein